MLHTSVDLIKVRKKTKIRNLNSHVPHLTKCTIWKKFKSHEKVAYKRKAQKKANFRNRYNQAPHLTQDVKWESDKITKSTTYKTTQRPALSQQVTTMLQDTDKTIHEKQYNIQQNTSHNIQESQEVPTAHHKAAMYRHDSLHKKHK